MSTSSLSLSLSEEVVVGVVGVVCGSVDGGAGVSLQRGVVQRAGRW